MDMKPQLKRLCALDIDRYCGAVEDVVGCLQDKDQELRDPRCQHAVQKDAELTSQDYRLRWGISTNCADEIDEICSTEKSAKEWGEPNQQGSVLNCLVKHRDKQSPHLGQDCKLEVDRLMRLQANNWRTNARLKVACEEDVRKFCFDVEVGHGKVHECLLSHFRELTDGCARAEFTLQSAMTANPTDNPRVQSSCAPQIQLWCRESQDHVKCLLSNSKDPKMSKRCANALRRACRCGTGTSTSTRR